MNLPQDYRTLSQAQRKLVREEYIKVQSGKCHYCKSDLNGSPAPTIAKLPIQKKLFPAMFFKNPIHLHHSHETGLTIGAVHSHCNAVLWQYEHE